MSSATRWQVGEVAAGIQSGAITSPIAEGGGPTNHMSPRQIGLDWLWRFYRCSNYDGRKYDWDGREQVSHLEHDIIATTGHIPPGFYDAGGALTPLKFRKPSAPYYLPRVVVNRFTSLLFSAKRHPQLEADDPDTEDWLQGFAEATRLWAAMIRARTYGGAIGSVGLSFKFVKGRPFVEVHDPRWCTPTFLDRDLLTVSRLEKLYQYVVQERDADGEWQDVWYWYRRIITDEQDVVWPKVRVRDEEPIWAHERSVSVRHGLGECPVVWIQNQQVDDDIDGDPDCHGCYELFERIDALWSQADRGTVSNCDPSLVISSDAEFEEVRKGSGNALQVEAGGTVKYLEIAGEGIKAAIALAEKLEEKALTIARCMLDRNEGGPSRTASEVEHNYSSMIEQADIYREQYGEKGIKQLLEMVLRAARKAGASRVDRSGKVPRIVVGSVRLPKKKVVDEKTGKLIGWQERKLGDGEQIELNWPQYFTPGGDVVGQAVEAAARALEARLVDQEHATGYVAEYFKVENRAEMIRNIMAQQQAGMLPSPAETAASRTLQEGGSPAPPGGWGPGEGGSPAPPGGWKPSRG